MARFIALALLAVLGACGKGDRAPSSEPGASLDSLPGVYAGALPCSNCAGITMTLWIRSDGRFFLRQRYAGENGAEGDAAHGLGRWRWDQQHSELALTGAGPERRFARLDEQRLELKTTAKGDHVLTRKPGAGPFSDRVRMEGESLVRDEETVFTECLTGLRFPVARGPGYDELRRQHRRMTKPGRPTLTEVEAHIVRVAHGATVQEMLVIDRMIVLKPRLTCSTRGASETRSP